MTHPTFDVYGYPSKATLELIEAWPIEDAAGAGVQAWLSYCREAWNHGVWELGQVTPEERSVFRVADGAWIHRCATGGWSGNESVLEAMSAHLPFWSLVFIARGRGGEYWFKGCDPHPAAA